jgi:hypothetical protein
MMVTNKNTKKLKKLEKYINDEILNIKKSSGKNTCASCGVNYVNLSKDMDDIELIKSNNKNSHKKSNFKKMYKKYFGSIKIIKIFFVIILLLSIILLNKRNLVNHLKLQLIKYELFVKLSNIKKYIIYNYQK